MPRMKELIEAGLFGEGLVDIDDPVLIARYNSCLEDMGLPKTRKRKIQIDRTGWSPQVAEEMKNDYYLSHGEANLLWILVTPEQANAPIYFPPYSFTWKMFDEWFATHRTQVADLTKDSAVWLDLDQEIDLYEEPSDLTMVSEMILRANTPIKIISGGIEQRRLVQKFLSDTHSHYDLSLIESIKSSHDTFGDLRKRSCIIRDHQFSDVVDFFSRVFGGVFVLRSKNKTPLVICRDPKVAKRHGLPTTDVGVIKQLLRSGYVTEDMSWWYEHTDLLGVIAESYLMDVLDKYEPKLAFLSLNSVKQKSYINKHSKYLDKYRKIMKLKRKLEKGSENIKVSKDVSGLLFHPSDDLSKISQHVIGQLLTLITEGRFIPYFYRHQKEDFIEAYTKKWKVPKREWARIRIREYYDCHASNKAYF